MRIISVLALGLALVMAGCAKDDSESEDDTPATNTPATNPTGGDNTGGNNTGGENNDTGGVTPTPTTPTPTQVHTDTVDFGRAPDAGQTTAVTTAEFTVPAGYGTLTLTVNYTVKADAPVIASNGVTVRILDAEGTEVAACPGPSAGPASGTTLDCTASGAAAAVGGTYTASYEGNGSLDATVSVMAS